MNNVVFNALVVNILYYRSSIYIMYALIGFQSLGRYLLNYFYKTNDLQWALL